MSFMFNFKYDYILALFIDLVYVGNKNDQYVFEANTLDVIKGVFNEGYDLHLTSCRVGSKKRVMCICKNQPDYYIVRKQQKDAIRYKIAHMQL